jgi:hypothetical protein
MIMQVKLTRRWAVHRAGQSVEVSDSQGRWLIQHNYAESSGDVRAPEQEAAAPGGNGPDPLAGGDATRRRPRITRPERDPERNYARTAEGAPPAAQRPGFGPQDRRREGEAGAVAQRAAEDAETTSASSARASTTSAEDGDDSKKTTRRRASKSDT